MPFAELIKKIRYAEIMNAGLLSRAKTSGRARLAEATSETFYSADAATGRDVLRQEESNKMASYYYMFLEAALL